MGYLEYAVTYQECKRQAGSNGGKRMYIRFCYRQNLKRYFKTYFISWFSVKS